MDMPPIAQNEPHADAETSPGSDEEGAEALNGSGPDALRELKTQMGAFGNDVARYVRIWEDAVELSVKSFLFKVALMSAGAVLSIGTVMAGVVLLWVGVSGAVSDGLETAPWLADLLVGGVVIVLFMVFLLGASRYMDRRSFKKRKAEYEQRRTRLQPGSASLP